MAKSLMLIGVLVFLVGAWMAWGPKVPFLGRLPGDIFIRKGPVTVYFPVVTCLVLSILISLLMRWFGPK